MRSSHGKTPEELVDVTKCKEMLPVIQAAKQSKEVISRNFINWCKTGDIESVKANIRMVDVNYQDNVHKNTGLLFKKALKILIFLQKFTQQK